MENICTKSQVVLDRSHSEVVDFLVDFGSEESNVWVTIDRDRFEDMGSPDTITVTIEPGDRLNQ